MKNTQRRAEKTVSGGKRAKRDITRRSPRKKLEPIPDIKTAKPGDFDTMSAETLLPMVRRSLELHGFKLPLWEIAETIQREYQLPKTPSEATIWRWTQEAHEAFLSDIKSLRAREMASQLQACDVMLRTWMPRAMDQMSIRRMQMVRGEMMEVIDQEALSEKVKAAGVVAKFMERKANLLGLDQGGGLPEGEGGNKTAEQLHAYLTKLATSSVYAMPQVPGRTLPAETLSLDSGVEHLEKVAG